MCVCELFKGLQFNIIIITCFFFPSCVYFFTQLYSEFQGITNNKFAFPPLPQLARTQPSH